MNTDTISTGIIAVDYSKSLQNMMADVSYDWVNPAITHVATVLCEGFSTKQRRSF